MTLYEIDYGLDCNGRKITVTNEYRCKICDSVSFRQLSDGSTYSISCKCKYMWDVTYLVTTYSDHGEDTLIITGYAEAIKRYEDLVKSGQVCTVSQVIRSNV